MADFAVFHDEGLASATPDASNNVWFGVDGTNDAVDGGAGDDILFGLDGNDTIAGGTGYDVAGFAATRAAATVTRNADGSVTVAGPDGVDTLRDVEVVRFADKALFTTTGADATIARLYGAAFARAPDVAGLQVQIDALHFGVTPQQLAANFIASAEFIARYGASPTDNAYVTALYNNVLGRVPDGGGFNVQIDALAHGLSRGQLLLNFADSPENQTKVAADWLLALNEKGRTLSSAPCSFRSRRVSVRVGPDFALHQVHQRGEDAEEDHHLGADALAFFHLGLGRPGEERGNVLRHLRHRRLRIVGVRHDAVLQRRRHRNQVAGK